MNKLFIIDSLALIYHAYKNKRIENFTKNGLNLSTILGFFEMVAEIIQSQKPTHLALAFDIKKPTFRHKLYNKYKAHRHAMPDEIKNSLPIIKDILGLMNIHFFELEGYEADDIIGTLAKKASLLEYRVYMVTPDKDFFQLIDMNTFICKLNKPGKNHKLIGIGELRNSFSVANAAQIADIMALTGDSSDNIPCIQGIGNRNARKLISQFGTIENIYNNLDLLTPKLREIFITQKETIELLKKLVTIDVNVPIEVNLEDLRNYGFNNDFLKKYLQEYKLK
jgi:DNA polymerase-1